MVSDLWLLIFTEGCNNHISTDGISGYYASSVPPELNITSGWCILLTPACFFTTSYY
ncbi:hypothetical protein predicted by Glimmer/Critica [Salmonella enterica subsp. enterica serovar Weltevreden str. 2007-60-3289-1]|nr:hypothetical protein predicted by Glimmer/Critica [Salmonella enterica subsp. enterica serovar Weltevreden str. 2007-60-3289-1]CDF54854.1 hypothetical protein BN855_26760 [Salmonella enterica subsp. enterica serovar Bovismorbificans str. 3114]